MQELVDMLEKQLACLKELAGLIEKQQKALKSVRSSAEAGSIAAAMEKLLLRLADIQEAEDAFVSKQGGSNVLEVLSKASSSDKVRAAGVLKSSIPLVRKLRRGGVRSRRLLDTNLEYARFNLNVLSNTFTDGTYGPGMGEPSEAGMKMFDSSV